MIPNSRFQLILKSNLKRFFNFFFLNSYECVLQDSSFGFHLSSTTAPKTPAYSLWRPLRLKQFHRDAALRFSKHSVSRKNNNLQKSLPSRKRSWQSLSRPSLRTRRALTAAGFSPSRSGPHPTRQGTASRTLGTAQQLVVWKGHCKVQKRGDTQLRGEGGGWEKRTEGGER